MPRWRQFSVILVTVFGSFCFSFKSNAFARSDEDGSSADTRDARAEVEYRGTFDQTIVANNSRPINPYNVLGSVIGNALNAQTERHNGYFAITAQLDGANSSAVFSGNGIQTIRATGSVSNGYCRFAGKTQIGSTITYEGNCSPRGFNGRMTGDNGRARLSGQFNTTATKYVDLDERDRQQSLAKANAERQAAVAPLPAASNVSTATVNRTVTDLQNTSKLKLDELEYFNANSRLVGKPYFSNAADLALACYRLGKISESEGSKAINSEKAFLTAYGILNDQMGLVGEEVVNYVKSNQQRLDNIILKILKVDQDRLKRIGAFCRNSFPDS